MRSMVRSRPAPSTWDASSSAGSMDFITAPIMHEGHRALEERHHPRDAVGRGHVDEVALAAQRPPGLVEEAAAGRADEAPGQRPMSGGDVVGERHELLQRRAPGDIGTREDPAHHEPKMTAIAVAAIATVTVLPKMWL